MTDSHDAEHGPLVKAYLVVFGALSVFTALSFLFNTLARGDVITHTQSFLLILGVAIIKATLVAMYFMHLKFDWGRLYFMIIPAFILGTMMMIVLLPDIVVGWQTSKAEPEAVHATPPH
jgi:cytochrome c oxidase subunit 4